MTYFALSLKNTNPQKITDSTPKARSPERDLVKTNAKNKRTDSNKYGSEFIAEFNELNPGMSFAFEADVIN